VMSWPVYVGRLGEPVFLSEDGAEGDLGVVLIPCLLQTQAGRRRA